MTQRERTQAMRETFRKHGTSQPRIGIEQFCVHLWEQARYFQADELETCLQDIGKIENAEAAQELFPLATSLRVDADRETL